MKVLHLAYEPISHPNGGLGVHVRAILPHLSEMGVDQTVINLPANESEIGSRRVFDSPGSLKSWRQIGTDLDTKHLVSNGELQLYEDLVLSHMAWAKYCKESFDVIHLHDSYLWPLAEFLRELHGSKIVITSHLLMSDVLSIYGGMRPKWQHQIETEVRAYQDCDHVITISEHYYKFLTDLLMVDPSMVTLIYNGVEFPGRVTVNPKPKRIGFLGRTAQMKGCHFVMQAIEALPEYEWTVITNIRDWEQDGYATEFKNFCESNPRVKFVNGLHHTQKWEYMQDVDLAVMPSIREPWGIVALEWMGIGVPIIASSIDGLKETVTPERGVPTDPTRLVEAILGYEYNQIRTDKAVEFAKGFTWYNSAKAILEVYKNVIKNS